jgi:class 3 adenylate cyclase/tetratricopeptide (TPR) repeat protein
VAETYTPPVLPCPSCGEGNPERARFCLICGAALSAEGAGERAHETRRRVTVLFADVAGSTNIGEQLDPEALREVMQRYFDAMRVAIERHEGTVEKFIGDAVMAVFGIPQLHEDDALRAVRAAFDMQTALTTLNRDIGSRWGVQLAIRTGINTGEVVAGDAATGQSLATGDVVNTAARLEQAAGSGEVLIGSETYRLVRHAVTAEPATPLSLKGKAEPVPAWRLAAVDMTAGGQVRRMDSPMVGRDRQLRVLLDVAERAREERAPQLVTVLGLAGVGKSRLVHEFLGQVRKDATVIRGRCLSYGDAITYWPLSEALREAAGIEPDDSAEQAMHRLQTLVGDTPQADVVAQRVAGAIGLVSQDAAAVGGQETFWAIRRLLEAMARRRPLVAVFDDIHWATPTFLDLLEHIADWSRDAPILLLAIARPELLEVRPTWGGGKLNATALLLEPLDDTAVNQIIANLLGSQQLPSDLARKIEEAAEGNPFFVEELLSMLVDDGVLEREGDAYRVTRTLGEIAVPPTVELLLAARLDHLPRDERMTLGRASVVGKRFGASEVAQLSPVTERETSLNRLMALVRKEIVRLDEQAASDIDALDEELRFRFRHQLVRDAAYEALPKHERAVLHEAFANWIEEALPHRINELHEVIGHHLEQAATYRRALGGDSDSTRNLARRAAGHLRAGARRADAVGDLNAVVRLLERGSALLDAEDPERLTNLPILASALTDMGRFEEALRAVDEVLASPNAPRAARAEALEQVGLPLETGRTAAQVLPMIDEALRIRRELGDPAGMARALAAASYVEFFQGRLHMARQLAEEGLAFAKEAQDISQEARLRGARGIAGFFSSEGGPAMLPQVHEDLAFARANGLLGEEAGLMGALAIMTAMQGSADEGLKHAARSREIGSDLGWRVFVDSSHPDVMIEIWRGNNRRAAERLRSIYENLTALGEKGFLSTVATELATVLLDMDETDQIEELCRVAEATGAADDAATQGELAAVRARLMARRGDLAAAETMARQAVAMADETEYQILHAWSRLALADVLRLAGRRVEAVDQIREVLAGEEHRGNQLYAATLREQIAKLEAAPDPQ